MTKVFRIKGTSYESNDLNAAITRAEEQAIITNGPVKVVSIDTQEEYTALPKPRYFPKRGEYFLIKIIGDNSYRNEVWTLYGAYKDYLKPQDWNPHRVPAVCVYSDYSKTGDLLYIEPKDGDHRWQYPPVSSSTMADILAGRVTVSMLNPPCQ